MCKLRFTWPRVCTQLQHRVSPFPQLTNSRYKLQRLGCLYRTNRTVIVSIDERACCLKCCQSDDPRACSEKRAIELKITIQLSMIVPGTWCGITTSFFVFICRFHIGIELYFCRSISNDRAVSDAHTVLCFYYRFHIGIELHFCCCVFAELPVTAVSALWSPRDILSASPGFPR